MQYLDLTLLPPLSCPAAVSWSQQVRRLCWPLIVRAMTRLSLQPHISGSLAYLVLYVPAAPRHMVPCGLVQRWKAKIGYQASR